MREAIGDYKVLEPVGSGGAAEVYRARDTRRGRTAAIKVLTSEVAMDAVLGPAFVREANLALSIDHPAVAALYEIEEQDGRPHLVFEFVPGQPLSALLAGHPLNARQAIEYAAQVADGLAQAHAGGVVHRMLRPDKIIITPKGTARVLDLGLGQYSMAVARSAADRSAAAAAMTYWAPEQLAGAAGDERADVWALGQILTEMVTGTPPDRGRTPNTGALPPDLRLLVARMTTDAPERRPQSAATVAAELRALAVGLEARRASAPAVPAPPVRTPKPVLPPWAIVASVLLVLAILVWLAARGA